MAGKKMILLLVSLGVLTFACSVVLSMLFGPKPQPPATEDESDEQPLAAMTVAAGLAGGQAKLTPKETQLGELIRELRVRINECKRRERQIEQREERFVIARELLKQQITDLENLQVQLLGPLTSLKQERAKLDQSRVLVAQEERANLKKAATIYDKMDPASSSQILAGMCENSRMEDAVKILYYMTERSAAKVLAALTDRSMAASLTESLKRIREEG
ncbi:MAG TPA: hypothetical protein VNA25_26635 [Phycisphaerae bacterium]|nr:hypothetical protein [Phycisphaerae bacterium]